MKTNEDYKNWLKFANDDETIRSNTMVMVMMVNELLSGNQNGITISPAQPMNDNYVAFNVKGYFDGVLGDEEFTLQICDSHVVLFNGATNFGHVSFTSDMCTCPSITRHVMDKFSRYMRLCEYAKNLRDAGESLATVENLSKYLQTLRFNIQECTASPVLVKDNVTIIIKQDFLTIRCVDENSTTSVEAAFTGNTMTCASVYKKIKDVITIFDTMQPKYFNFNDNVK